jgi:hypothetical protein
MRKLLPVLFLFASPSAFAQFNDTTHYHVNLNSTGSINRANGSSTYLLNNTVAFGVKTKSLTISASDVYVYGKQNSTLTNNDNAATVFVNLLTKNTHFYYWGLLNYNTSYSLHINNQILGGGGVAYSVVDTKNAYLNFSDGVLYDQSDLLVSDIYHTWRNSVRVNMHFSFNDVVVFDSSNFLQNSFDNGTDYIIKSTTTATFKLRKWIGLTSGFTYNRMNITHSENFLLTYGLTIDKYF